MSDVKLVDEPKIPLSEGDVLSKLMEEDDDKVDDKTDKADDDLDLSLDDVDDKSKTVEESDDEEADVNDKKTKSKSDDEDEEEKLDVEDDELKALIPPRRKEILTKYPKLFKEFPALERAMYREQQYTEVYPTVKDAKESVEALASYRELEKDLSNGKIDVLLGKIKEQDEETFKEIADNYLAAIYTVDKDAGLHVINNLVKNYVKSMVGVGRQQNNDQLIAAAELLYQFQFGNKDWVEPTKIGKGSKKEENPVDVERQEFLKERFEIAHSDLSSRIDNKLASVITDAIDPEGQMSDYVKKNAVRDSINALHKAIGEDNRTQVILKKLWEQASKDKFGKDSVGKIGSAYLSTAKSLLRPIIRKYREEALRGLGKKEVTKEEKSEKGKSGFRGSDQVKDDKPASKKGEMKPGQSIHEFLMED